jgi:DNA-directed RNA polymerase specialized sigma24 family protein
MSTTRRDHYIPPCTGADSRRVLDAATQTLGAARHLDAIDPAATLHLLASLTAELQARLAAAVVDVRRQGASWAEIADLLGVTRASAWQRYAGAETANAGDGVASPDGSGRSSRPKTTSPGEPRRR